MDNKRIGWTAIFVASLIIIEVLSASHGTAISSTQSTSQWYDYRTHPAWNALTDEDQEKVEQVTRDFVLLWGAIDMYVSMHGGEQPQSLDELVPCVLRSLPIDPFSDSESRYKYRVGAEGNYAFVLSSSGLSSFPYLARTGNVGLYQCRGVWISGINPRMAKQ